MFEEATAGSKLVDEGARVLDRFSVAKTLVHLYELFMRVFISDIFAIGYDLILHGSIHSGCVVGAVVAYAVDEDVPKMYLHVS